MSKELDALQEILSRLDSMEKAVNKAKRDLKSIKERVENKYTKVVERTVRVSGGGGYGHCY